jgi:hypothetical protein
MAHENLACGPGPIRGFTAERPRLVIPLARLIVKDQQRRPGAVP